MKKHSILMAAVLALAAMQTGARAADLTEPVPDSSDWTFTAAAYLWASGINGTSGVFGFQPQDIDVSFGDILEHLDMAFMGMGEARNGPFSLGMDLMYSKIGASVDTPAGILASSLDVTMTNFVGTAVAGYAVMDSGSSHLDVVAGARLWSVNSDFDFEGGSLDGTSADDGGTWVDPVIGAKFRADLGSDFYVSGWGLIGGFGVSSAFMWDVMAGIGYEFNDSVSAFAGYRALGVDYSHDGFVYDVTQHGPIVAAVFRF